MGKVERYTWVARGMARTEAGDFVRFDDYAKLERELQDLRDGFDPEVKLPESKAEVLAEFPWGFQTCYFQQGANEWRDWDGDGISSRTSQPPLRWWPLPGQGGAR